MDNFLDDNSLIILQTKYNYGKLDSGRDTCEYDIFYKEAKHILDSNEGLKNDSDKILRALCYVYKNRLSGVLQSEICNFLYYWLGNILIDKMTHKTVFFDVIIKLFNTLKNNISEKLCNLPHPYMYVNNFEKIKLFFDYSEDYNTYKHQLTGKNNSCNENYKTYLDKYVNSYKEVKVECAENKNPNSYCNEFHYYFKDKNDDLLSKWTCELQERRQQEEELGDDITQNPKLPLVHGIGVVPSTSLNQFSSLTGQKEKRPGYSDYPSTEATLELSNNSLPSDDSSPSTIKKSITSAVSAAGLLVPPFLLYNVISITILKLNVLFYI
ncbi:hypothetical protein PVNG_05554 [Plasmodium vivax North Korean]|uniref:Variable surface protein Vir7-like protein n=1 Tax=Plasmodium vivax North Korean TaxID=1035514 RepID=A0A0J9U304_PLAVI|nr:hypothetical protein PVNG_05554 [Plasmodium vivax North Korean]